MAHRNWERLALNVCSVEGWLGAMDYWPLGGEIEQLFRLGSPQFGGPAQEMDDAARDLSEDSGAWERKDRSWASRSAGLTAAADGPNDTPLGPWEASYKCATRQAVTNEFTL